MDDNRTALSAQLRAYRQTAGLSQQELADRSGLSVRAVSDMERGRTQWPYRESLTRLADALELQETARAEFLAAAPRRLGRQLPAGTPALADGAAAAEGRGRAVPRQLPGGARHFTGRVAELAVLDQLLDQVGQGEPGTAVISAIGGTAGVGKTALALTWAHQVAGHFPDGQLYVNLRGYDAAEPVPAEEALAWLLRALGVPGPDIPAGAEERAAAYRSLLVGRAMLIVLDNVCRVDQVRPLLPASSSCVTVVTSRDSLAGLVARDGAIPVMLDLLPLADAVALLRELIGGRAADDPDAAARLAVCCGRLPLALRVAAELATSRPQGGLALLAAELEQRQRRLDLLEADGDSQTAVREVFSWSLRHLDPGTAGAFRLAALHPGTDLDAWALAAMARCSHEQADRMLRELARAHLVQPASDSRYCMHDLLRIFGRELAAADEAGERAALTGLLDYLQHAATAAMDTLYPAEAEGRPRPAGPAGLLPPLNGEQPARGWLDAERATLIAAASYAADHGWPGHAVILAGALSRYLDVGGYFSEAITVHDSALRAAELTDDPAGEVRALINLGNIYIRQSQHEHALRCYERALDIAHLTGDQHAEYRVLTGLAISNQLQGRYRQAAINYRQILDLGRSAGSPRQQIRGLLGLGTIALMTGQYRQAGRQLQQAVSMSDKIGERVLMANALGNLGDLRLRQGRYQEAADHFERCAATSRVTGDQMNEAYTTCYLALVGLRQGQYRKPETQLREALTRFQTSGNRHGEALTLTYLGELQLRSACYKKASDDLEQALLICDQSGDFPTRAEALNRLGEVHLATEDPTMARARHHEALAVATRLTDRCQQAHAHRGLGNAEAALGNQAQARWHWEQALARFAQLGAIEAGQVRTQLAATLLSGSVDCPPEIA